MSSEEHTAEKDVPHDLPAHAYGGGFGVRVKGCPVCEESGEQPGTPFRGEHRFIARDLPPERTDP